uniref:Mating pheromone receptor a1 n=1 Tax=Rhodosporidiobolus azoricus TaxID=145577 RepID=G8H2V0_9BASI|nr:mating pheromone receptor a1 [Rhodosporidiobolus azoricus]
MFSPAFATFNFLGVAFILLPAAWHWRARNTATLLFIFWCFVTVLPQAINSVIWYHGVEPEAPIWCDIMTKLRVGGDVGIPAAVLCITRQLEAIAAARTAHFSAEDRRRRRLVDLAIGLGLPILVMILHTIVQGHRYDIIQRIGCTPTIYWSLPAIFLVVIWPLILDLTAAVYAVLAMRLFIARRYQFARILEASKSAISTSRFIRLMALSTLQIVYAFPVALVLRGVQFAVVPLDPYTSWGDVHQGFGYIGTATLAEYSLGSGSVHYARLQELSAWGYAISCTFFFIFFGLGEESLSVYRGWIARAGKICGMSRFSSWEASNSSHPEATQVSLPPYPRSEQSYTKEAEQDFPTKGVMVTVEEDNYTSV